MIIMVARWFIFVPKLQFFINFWVENVGTFYGHLAYFIVILWSIGVFCSIWYIFPALVCCFKNNLATLMIMDLSQEICQRGGVRRKGSMYVIS
jgi:hypothetical protein